MGEMTSALVEQTHSSAHYESCSHGSFSCPAVDSSSLSGYATVKDQMDDSQLSGSSGAEEDEEKMSRKVKVKRDATKRVLIDKGPPILTIHLKRFSQDARGRLSKLNGHVNFGEVLDLRPYMDPRYIFYTFLRFIMNHLLPHLIALFNSDCLCLRSFEPLFLKVMLKFKN